jgi:hypothetical protein
LKVQCLVFASRGSLLSLADLITDGKSLVNHPIKLILGGRQKVEKVTVKK